MSQIDPKKRLGVNQTLVRNSYFCTFLSMKNPFGRDKYTDSNEKRLINYGFTSTGFV